MEALARRSGAVGVDRDDGVGAGLLTGAPALVDARAHAVVVGAGQHDMDATRGQPLRHALRDVEGEGVLGVPGVRRRPRRVARLGPPATVGNLAVDRRRGAGIASVVAGVEDDDAGARGRSRRRRPAPTGSRTRVRRSSARSRWSELQEMRTARPGMPAMSVSTRPGRARRRRCRWNAAGRARREACHQRGIHERSPGPRGPRSNLASTAISAVLHCGVGPQRTR